MADVADGQDVSEHAVAVAVELGRVLLEVVEDHLALGLAALVGIEANIVGVLVELQGRSVKLAGGGVGRLAVVPNQRLVLVGDGCAGGAGGAGGGGVPATTAADEAKARDGGANARELEELTT